MPLLPEHMEVVAVFIGTVMSALMLGYLGGLLSFRVKSRWCPACGNDTVTLEARRRLHAGAK
jgi:hypothetical protein